MGRIRKWGNRRAGVPFFGRLRLPRFSWSGLPRSAGRSPAFKAKPSKAVFRPPGSGARFAAKPSRSGAGASSRGGVFVAKPSRSGIRPDRKEAGYETASPGAGAGAPGYRVWRKASRSGGFSLFRGREGKKQEAVAGKGRKPRRRGRFWIILSLLLILAVLQGLRYVEQHLKPPILHLAQIRVKQIATESINKAITSQVADGGNAEALIDWKTDKNGKISGFMLNYKEHMRITSQAAEVIQSTLQELHNQTEHIPLGQALGSPLIASFGPDIPIKIEPQGAVKVELNTRQQNAGINMILVEVFIHIVTEVAVVIPFDMEPQIVDTEIPVSYLMVVGDVPMYYYDNQGQPVGENGSSAPGIAIPAPSLNTEKNGTGVDGTVPDESGSGGNTNSGENNTPAGSGNSAPSTNAENAGANAGGGE
ncbi:sporulation protein YunB [Paenibacillus sp. FSL R10-2199]|uniref:sporulation protein YunB n=1 Tax=Paenibacillus sp. FSL R10-2199 TaxID=2975348 RepID=UPI0030F4B9A1